MEESREEEVIRKLTELTAGLELSPIEKYKMITGIIDSMASELIPALQFFLGGGVGVEIKLDMSEADDKKLVRQIKEFLSERSDVKPCDCPRCQALREELC